MALVKTSASSLILINEGAKSFTGKNVKDLADSIANALVTYAVSTPNLVTYIGSGVMGPVGQVISISVAPIVPSAMAALMVAKAQSFQLTGTKIFQLFQAISNGVSTHFQTVQMSGTTAGLAVGFGTGKFTNIVDAAVANLIKTFFVGKQLLGKNAPQLAECIAFGFANHMKQSPVISATVTGAVSPVPPAGPIAITGIPTVFNKLF